MESQTHGSGGGGRSHWYRLMQGINECGECRRFAVTTPRVLKDVGGSRADAEEAERRAQQIDRARDRLKGKRIVKRNNQTKHGGDA